LQGTKEDQKFFMSLKEKLSDKLSIRNLIFRIKRFYNKRFYY